MFCSNFIFQTLNRNSSKSSLLRSMDPKRVSFGAGSSRASGALTPSAVQPTNVPPPSPMRPEFTSDSPAGTPKYFMAGRELQFNQTPDDYYEQISITKCRKERNPSGDSDDSFPGTSIERGGTSVPFGSVPSNILQSSAEKLPNAMNESGSLEAGEVPDYVFQLAFNWRYCKSAFSTNNNVEYPFQTVLILTYFNVFDGNSIICNL